MTHQLRSYFLFAGLCISVASYAEITPDFAPQKVVGKTFYGTVKETDKLSPNIVLDFRAPFMRQNRIAFYPASGPDKNKIKNSGYYLYQKIGPASAYLIYASDKGLTPKLLFKFNMTFTRKNAGTFKAHVYKYQKLKDGVDAPQRNLLYVKTQTGTFQIQ